MTTGSNNKFILIDGSSMLVTNYYGNLPKALLFEKDPEKKEKLFSPLLSFFRSLVCNNPKLV